MNKTGDITTALNWATQQFAQSPHLNQHGSAKLDAELLLSHCLHKPRSYIRSWPEAALNSEQQSQFRHFVERRARSEPIAYILSQREFWDLNLHITKDTLIPRPETELLVETALEFIPIDQTWHIADLGTGSGAIALSIAKHRPQSQLTALDVSNEALAVAKRNALQHQLTNVSFLHSDWFANLATQRFHMIVSNPPYVLENDPHLHQGDVAFEPRQALTAGPQGLDDLAHIIARSMQFLAPEGRLLVEHGYHQGNAVSKLFEQAGWKNIICRQDLSRQDRITYAQKPPRRTD